MSRSNEFSAKDFDPVQWAEITISRWEEKILQLGIGHTNSLINSFQQHVVTDSNGNPLLISLAFNHYAKFVDMGVGRGVSLSETPSEGREAKPWRNKVFARELAKLAELILDRTGKKALLILTSTIEEK